MAKFKKGEGGRPKGAKNKTTTIGKDTISNYLDGGGYQNLIDEIDELEGNYKVQALLKLIEFVVPKQKAIEHSGGENIIGLVQTMFTATGIEPITSENDDHLDD